jgi:C4-dicarboxylate-specific signal transduction histidine kinase
VVLEPVDRLPFGGRSGPDLSREQPDAGQLSVATRNSGRALEEAAPRLRLVAAVLANALAREGAEREARRNRDELAHSLRVSTMGVLASSLAHELHQPLGAIMANAETALERVQEGAASRGELLEMLQDVVDDDQRAADVIARIRSMLKKGESHHIPFDLNQVVWDAAHLLRGDALAHGVTLRLHLEPGTPFVRGDRVQIQQVLVNLVLNALEANTSAPGGDSEVLILTSIVENAVEVSVEDPGGLPEVRAGSLSPLQHERRDGNDFDPGHRQPTAAGAGLRTAPPERRSFTLAPPRIGRAAALERV